MVEGQLTPKQKVGKQIYTKGIGGSDVKIMAKMSGVDVPATIMPCVNCHNSRGTGNPEGGITPSNITWQSLTKSYEVKRQDGKTRPAYDERSLRKVITTGIDPAGNELHSSMPRYNMTREDIDNLIAYIKVLGADYDKGLSSNKIKIGFHLPDKNESTRNKAVRDLVNAYVEKKINSKGMYNRKVEVTFLKNDVKNPDEVFMVTGFNQTQTSSAQEVPTLMATADGASSTTQKNVFYIYPSRLSQNTSLVDYGNALVSYQQSPPVIVYYESQIHKQIAQQLKTEIESNYKVTPLFIKADLNNSRAIAENNKIISNQVVHFVGPYQIGNKLLSALDAEEKYPQILLSGTVSSIDVTKAPSKFGGKIFLGFPTWITTRSANGLQLYKELQESYNLDSKWRNLQFDTLVMMMTIKESLKKTGVNVDRESFRDELESLYEFSTGLMQPLTFSSNKHIGSTVIYILSFNVEKQRMEIKTMINSDG